MRNSILILAFLFIVSGCKDREAHADMLAKFETTTAHCVGRHVIEIPRSFAQSNVTTGVFRQKGMNGNDPAFEVAVRATPTTLEQFKQEVQRRRIELKTSGTDDTNVLRVDRVISDSAALFRVQEIDDAYVSEVMLLRGTSLVTVSLESYRGQFQVAEESLVKFVDAIKEKAGDVSAPASGGFCLGPVVITGSYKDESGSFVFADGKGSTFSLTIDSFAPDEKAPLLTRMSSPDSLLTKFDIRNKVLRSRELTVAGMRAQEWLGWATLDDEINNGAFSFALETRRAQQSEATPSVHLEFDTARPLASGTPTKTTMSEAAAIKLWDSVVQSIRFAAR